MLRTNVVVLPLIKRMSGLYVKRPKNHFNQANGQKIPSPNNPHLSSFIGAFVGALDGAVVGEAFAVKIYLAVIQSYSEPNSYV